MKGIFITIVLGLFLVGNASAQSKTQLLDSLFRTANKKGFFNGNVLVAEKDTIVYQSEIGYADASRTKELTPDLRFNIGSISKGFSAVGLMKLKEEGKLNLDDSISNFIPTLPEWSQRVTIRHLLEYSSGLPKVDYQKIMSDDDAREFLETLALLEFEPGTAHLYSNFNIFLRKRIIEEVSGKTYTAFLRSEIFTPCSMENVVLDPSPVTPALAKAFDNKWVQDNYPAAMSGAVYATAHDLYRWTKCLQDYTVIGKPSFMKMAGGYKTMGSVRMEGNDWSMYYHHGSSYNFESSVYVNPKDRFTVILTTNNKNFNVGDLTNAADAILRGNPFDIPKKSLYMALRTEVYYNGFDNGKRLFDHIINAQHEDYDLSNTERDLDKTGHYLLGKGKVNDGVKTLEWVISEFPGSWKAHLSLAEAYQEIGRKEWALCSYKKASQLNDDNRKIKAKIEKIETK